MAAGILLSRELGLLNFAVCITTMPLTADHPMTDPVCPHPSCADLWRKQKSTPCLDVCPECLSGELEGERIKWMRYDRRICSTRAQNEGMGALQRIILEGANEPDPERRKTILLGSFSRTVMEAVASGNVTGQCSECVRVCPIHRDAQKLSVKMPAAEELC